MKDAFGNPVPNATVTFTAPSSGASLSFAGGTNSASAVTDATGTASSPAMTANATAGSYNLSATVSGIATPATEQLSNITGVEVVLQIAAVQPPSAFNPPSITVDGVAYNTTHTFNWNTGESHTISAAAIQTFNGGQYVFTGWSDSGAATHTIAPASSGYLTASFKPQIYLSTSAGSNGTITPASGYYDFGPIQITATPAPGYKFLNFTGGILGSANPQTLNLTSQTSIEANFGSIAPILTATLTSSSGFTQGGTNSYQIQIANAYAAGTTSGPITVTENLPPGLTLLTSSGLGWTCSGPVCTTNAPVAGGGSLPDLTVTVRVAANAPSNVTNQITVSGGGAASVTTTINMHIGAQQAITFPPLSDVTYGAAPITVSATATSGLPVTFRSVNTNVCLANGNTVTIVGGGLCEITASQTGNASYGPVSLTRGFFVNPATQTVTISPVGNVSVNAQPITVHAIASSGLPVSVTAAYGAACFASGNTVSFTSAAGVCTLTASQPGNADYLPASATVSFNVGGIKPQSISFPALPANVTMPAAAITLSATASSGLPVQFNANGSNICKLNGNTLSFVGGGTCSVVAFQPGGGTWAAATPVIQKITVTGPQTINFPQPPDVPAPSQVTLAAYASSQLPVVFTSETPAVCTVRANVASVLGPGKCTVQAWQPGNAFFLPATPVSVTFVAGAGSGASDSGSTGGGGGSTSGGGANGSNGGSSGGASGGSTTGSSAGGGTGGGYTGGAGGSAPSPAAFTASISALNFSWSLGDSGAPASQRITIFSSPSGASFHLSASTSSGNAGWLSVSNSSGAAPATFEVSVDPSQLTAGNFSGAVTISASGSSSVSVPVTFTISNASPKLSASGGAQLVSSTGNKQFGAATVANSGGGTLHFTAVGAVDQGSWLSLGTTPGSATPSSPAVIPYTVDPSGLGAGTYSGRIIVSDTDSSAQAIIPITLTVNPQSQSLRLSETALTFNAVAGAASPPPQTVLIAFTGSGDLKWAATVSMLPAGSQSSAAWLSLPSSSGVATAGAVGTPLTVAVNTANLVAGQYYGTVNITSPDAANSPQAITVVLNVSAAPQSTSSALAPQYGAIVIHGLSGATVQQSIGFVNPSGAALAYSATAFTSAGVNWLSVAPASGSADPGLSQLTISADFSSASPGIQTGAISITSGSAVSTVQVIAIVQSSAAAASGGSHDARATALPQSACVSGKAAYLVSAIAQPLDQQLIYTGQGQQILVQVFDDCGNPLSAKNGGSVQVTFSDGEPTVALMDVGQGVWQASWSPTAGAASVQLRVVASKSGAPISSLAANSVTITVQQSDIPRTTGVVNAAAGAAAMPQVVAPGSYVAIYGASFTGAQTGAAAAALPLGTNLNGAQVLLGGVALPLLYAGSGQINALIPQSIAPNSTFPLIIQRGGAESVPAAVTVASLAPGIYTRDFSGSGQGIVEISGTTLIAGPQGDDARPVQSGSEYAVVYCTGLGTVTGPNGEAPPADGAAAPLSPVYHTTASVTATLGGVSVPVLFSGLTPTLAGLYQVNIRIPAGAPTGDAVPLVITATDPKTGVAVHSNTVTIAVQ